MDHVAHLRRDAARVEHLLRSGPDLTVPVPWCGDWTAYDVVTHLGAVHRWAAAATTTQPDGRVEQHPEPQGLGASALADWFAAGAAVLLDALAVDHDTVCWTLAEPRRVGSWARRQAHETAVHRWDLETAVALPTGIDPELADDGIAELVDTIVPRQVRLGRLEPGPAWVELVLDGRVVPLATLPPGDRHPRPATRVTGTSADVLLLLWGREPASRPRVEDETALRRFLRGALTP